MQSRLTPARPIDIHDIDAGLDRKVLTELKQRSMDLNRIRCARTYAALTQRQQQFFQLLPLLFHVNHPQLPGYISHQAPAGIYGYEPDEATLRAAKTLARSIHYKRDLTEKSPHIDALFLMGSVGTIGQSDASDLDIWVCHNLTDASEAIIELERKCALISRWAEQNIHLEVHCFLMRSGDFSQQRKQQLSSEGSGSAQHFLLLDEFYRTALWLAGKVPLWWFVPASQEGNYANFCATLIGKRFIKQADVIDFGPVPFIPPEEFLGAGVWHLYKGIESPYKSVLKLMLLEAYASDKKNNAAFNTSGGLNENSHEPLALTFKRAIYNAIPDANALDPYVMVYQRLEFFLTLQQQPARLELARRCFYFKANKALSRASPSSAPTWQRQLLETLLGDWHWPVQQLKILDARAQWKADQVIRERDALVNELSNGYRLLLQLHKRSEQTAAINHEDLAILGRKLHAAFERKAGKMDWINPGISKDLSEDQVCCLHVHREGDESWQLLRGSAKELAMSGVTHQPIKHARSLVELLLWCHVNGIISNAQQFEILSDGFSFTSLQKYQLFQTLQQWLPTPKQATHAEFARPAVVERVLFVINMGVEPHADLHKKGLQILSARTDALGYSGLRENLVLTADVIQINSWGETLCRHYSAEALVNCLQHYFRLINPNKFADGSSDATKACIPLFEFCCFSSQGDVIAQRLTELWRDIIHCFFETRQRNTRYILEAGDAYLLLQFGQNQVQLTRYYAYEKLLEKLGEAQLEFNPTVIDRYALRDKPLRLVNSVVKPGGIYLFYYLEKTRAAIMIADEKGSLFTCNTEFYSEQTLLRPMLHFIQATLQRLYRDGDLINNPHSPIEVHLYKITGTDRHLQLSAEQPLPGIKLGHLDFINIKAVAEFTNQTLGFSIFCDEQEFSAITHGDELFNAVANYIIQRRQRKERYPCYITDLDLSLCRETLAQQTGLQLSHYLQIKAELESKLNLALSDLR